MPLHLCGSQMTVSCLLCHVGSGDQAQVVRVGVKHTSSPSTLTSPQITFYIEL